MNSEVTLTLTVDEANTVLESLGNLPFVRVHDLVYKIKSQAQAQVNRPAVSPSGNSQQTADEKA